MSIDVDSSMGNVELRLTLANIESEIAEVKSIAIDTKAETQATNGKVARIIIWKEQMIGRMQSFGLCLVLIIIPLAGWVLYNQVTEPERIKDAVSTYFSQYNVQIKP